MVYVLSKVTQDARAYGGRRSVKVSSETKGKVPLPRIVVE